MSSARHRAADARQIPWNRLALILAFVWLVVGPVTPGRPASPPGAGPGASQHVSGSVGFDISYPQCPKPQLPTGDFGIVGVNHGRPFTTNPCLGRLYGWAARFGTPSLYLNVAFDMSYRDRVAATCLSAVPSAFAGARKRLAWAVGCSEAAYSVARAPGPATQWWVDVETVNSWGRSPGINRTAIQGAVWFLHSYGGRPVGVYSSERSWLLVTGFGDWNPPGATANWLGVALGRTGATAAQDCGTGFSGAPVALVQFYRHGPGGLYDANYAC